MNWEDRIETYVLIWRYLVPGEGWKREEETLETSYRQAGYKASAKARELDETYGDSHFWTVDLKAPDGGSYYQLFHGRLR